MPERNICVLSARTAIVSGRGVRSPQGRERVFGGYGWTYSLVETADV